MLVRFKNPPLTRCISSTVPPTKPPTPIAATSKPSSTLASSSLTQGQTPHPTTQSLDSSFFSSRSPKAASAPGSDPWAPIFDALPTPSATATPKPTTMSRQPFSRAPAPSFFTPNLFRNRRNFSTTATQDEDETAMLWEHILDGVDSESSRPRKQGAQSSLRPSIRQTPSRPTMSAPEVTAFDNMFDMIFNAATETREMGGKSFTSREAEAESSQAPMIPPSTSVPGSSDPALESTSITPNPSTSLTRMRRQSNRLRRTNTEMDVLLDSLKEEIDLCPNDLAVLQWAQNRLFLHAPGATPASDSAPSTPSPTSPSTYPHLLTHLMHLFRTTYQNPHTSLALFTYAKRRSIPSYVFGCTTPAYNELLLATWEIDHDVKGVEDILREMRANGVKYDGKTRKFVEDVRRDVGEWVVRVRDGEMGVGVSAGEEDPWDVVQRIEGMTLQDLRGKEGARKGERGKEGTKTMKRERKKMHWDEEWKKRGIKEEGLDKLTLL